ncbi:DNA-binding transcriptional regulator, MarR family [Pseudooceanicola antarcticus]|uniref:DNA-binding transcriptional regulator, MarR family n=1 Tax=Pseudooceanicola antarcticus TaxID=1247613 RepID=A0A285ILG9_9RHOB|nr:MarR family winged helix-turn-helix transcriptional regulator [Pseudooceanicola antarcticus]PJE28667.1 MarR family transcriptional regulator [Pseudooceanicola antarcticus]SNY48607.1 DNA-binding transcriptional regulator, MarR family [Pseudooceanicola antarcticus]
MKETEDSETIPLLFDHGVLFRITGVANRLNRSAAVFYRDMFGIGLPEWRMMLALGKTAELKVGDAARSADLDTAQASRALKLLKARDLVTMEMTASRGRATIVRLTDSGRAFHAQVLAAGERRAEHIRAGFTPEELEQLFALLGRVGENAEALIELQRQTGQEL